MSSPWSPCLSSGGCLSMVAVIPPNDGACLRTFSHTSGVDSKVAAPYITCPPLTGAESFPFSLFFLWYFACCCRCRLLPVGTCTLAQSLTIGNMLGTSDSDFNESKCNESSGLAFDTGLPGLFTFGMVFCDGGSRSSSAFLGPFSLLSPM